MLCNFYTTHQIFDFKFDGYKGIPLNSIVYAYERPYDIRERCDRDVERL